MNTPCAQCNTTGKPTSVCKACMIVYYCSRECQAQHWPLHKPTCKQAQLTDYKQGVEDVMNTASTDSTVPIGESSIESLTAQECINASKAIWSGFIQPAIQKLQKTIQEHKSVLETDEGFVLYIKRLLDESAQLNESINLASGLLDEGEVLSLEQGIAISYNTQLLLKKHSAFYSRIIEKLHDNNIIVTTPQLDRLAECITFFNEKLAPMVVEINAKLQPNGDKPLSDEDIKYLKFCQEHIDAYNKGLDYARITIDTIEMSKLDQLYDNQVQLHTTYRQHYPLN